jgi:thioredoxin 1
MSSELSRITTDTFEAEVLNSPIPVLVDFWAEWCAPCKMMMPALEAAREEFGDRIRIVKLDVDAERDLAARYKVRSIPTLMLFIGGNAEETKVGALSKSQIVAMIDSRL